MIKKDIKSKSTKKSCIPIDISKLKICYTFFLVGTMNSGILD